jgi:hypothetical protein
LFGNCFAYSSLGQIHLHSANCSCVGRARFIVVQEQRPKHYLHVLPVCTSLKWHARLLSNHSPSGEIWRQFCFPTFSILQEVMFGLLSCYKRNHRDGILGVLNSIFCASVFAYNTRLRNWETSHPINFNSIEAKIKFCLENYYLFIYIWKIISQ